MATPTPQFYRKRSSAPKLKTGCVTCKQRHIKCDEKRPACLRCKKAGKVCGGYVHPTKARSAPNMTEPQHSSLQSLTLPPKESRAMSFYLRVVAIELAGWQCTPFWNKDVVRLAANHCSVRYALVSLSNFYESMYTEGVSQVERQQCGLEFYNMAIGSLYQHFEQGTRDCTAIVVCIIFICTDLLRGEHLTAMKHFDGAIGLIKEWEESNHASFTDDELRMDRQTIRPMLRWLNTLPFILGTPLKTISKTPASTPESKNPVNPFSTIVEATAELMSIVFRCADYWKQCRGQRYAFIQDQAVLLHQTELLGCVNEWKEKLQSSIRSLQFLASITREHDIQLVACSGNVVEAFISTSLHAAESVWDGYRDMFEEILLAAERSCEAPSIIAPTQRSSRFCFGIGTVPLLQLVAWKCRWPHIRRRAIQILRSAKRRETVFDSENMANLFTKLQEIEESALNLPEGEIPKEGQLPPEEARVHRIDVAPLPPTPEGLAVNFLLKRSDGTCHIRCGYVNFVSTYETVDILNNAINLVPP
ncbi:hypothetical protein E2P81_ATG09449 [Venturia nashicola]|uniref:Zn(2)-C6 fungal-type domain-containing protein n=1 Tax=Venturia nashicola TaxID=86259 RepID=A0A4Z1NZ80_9PEZI|nr:hypothetical protein E6O75_ATG09658 [Venturia nashicola]TLD25792.1 hypothetical protein E2P81_ATG09449 [Venturia nashicola]